MIWSAGLLGCVGLFLLLLLVLLLPLLLTLIALTAVTAVMRLLMPLQLVGMLAPLCLAALVLQLLLLLVAPLLLLWLPLLSWKHGALVYYLDCHLHRRLMTGWELARWATEWIVDQVTAGSSSPPHLGARRTFRRSGHDEW